MPNHSRGPPGNFTRDVAAVKKSNFFFAPHGVKDGGSSLEAVGGLIWLPPLGPFPHKEGSALFLVLALFSCLG